VCDEHGRDSHREQQEVCARIACSTPPHGERDSGGAPQRRRQQQGRPAGEAVHEATVHNEKH
jgi:hypothetical protein